jgi:hypothetical protein
MFEYVGALHIHSVFSDGSGEPDLIARLADEIGLDFIALTDHNTLRALKDGYEGWYGNTLMIVGCEINDKENKNHYLAFDIDEALSTRTSAKTYVKKVKDAGGIGFLAHPHEKRNHMKEHPAYPWTDWDTKDFTGIEIWNHMSEWMENLTEQNKYQSFIHPLKTIIAPPPETLKVWDTLNQERLVPAIGGTDAHAHKYNVLGFMEVEVFPYKVLFKSIRTHILADTEIKKGKSQKDIANAKKIIYSALKNGRSFVANDYCADSKGFRFYAHSKNKIYQMGDSVPQDDNNMLKVLLPGKAAEIKLYRNGTLIDSLVDSEADFCVNLKGVYRVEIYLEKKAWIFSNPIRIGY